MIKYNISPLAEEIRSPPPAEELFQRLAGLPYCLFLDSAMRHPALGRYSFLAADPFDVARVPADGSDALRVLEEKMLRFATERSAGLPAVSRRSRRIVRIRTRPQYRTDSSNGF